MNPKKRPHNSQGFNSISPKRAKVPITGPAFMQGIDNITSSNSPNIYTHVSIPLGYEPAKAATLDLHATFSAIDHNPIEGKAWTQGWMEMGGKTTYEDILPESLSVERATVESRVMKKQAKTPYAPKTMHFPGVTNKQNIPTQHWGRIAMQSYVEDITARTGLHLEEVGSGMRAMTLASKLRMKAGRSPSPEPGFRNNLRTKFPQMLTAANGGGAAHLSTKIDSEIEGTGNSLTQLDLWNKVVTAHREVNRESRNRFNYKWKSIKAGTITTTDAGKWWVDKFGANKSGPGSLPGKGKKSKLRRDYVGTKLSNHGITHFK